MRCATSNCRGEATEVGPDGLLRCGDCGDYLYRRLPDRAPLLTRFREAWRAGRAAVLRAQDEISQRDHPRE